MPTMTCPRAECAGEIEYEIESVDSGDGVWAQSGVIGMVLWEHCTPEGEVAQRGQVITPERYTHCLTWCGCRWTSAEIDELDERATKLAGEWTGGEP